MKDQSDWTNDEILVAVIDGYKIGKDMILLRDYLGESALYHLEMPYRSASGLIDLANFIDLTKSVDPECDLLSCGRKLEKMGFFDRTFLMDNLAERTLVNQIPSYINRLLCDLRELKNEK